MHSTIIEVLELATHELGSVSFGGEPILPGDTFDDHGVEDGGRLDVGIHLASLWEIAWRGVLQLNPHLTEDDVPYPIMDTRERPPRVAYSCKSWQLSSLQLVAIPEAVAELSYSQSLDLSNNKLSTLPRGFEKVRIGGDLWLDRNRLEPLSLPWRWPGVQGRVTCDDGVMKSPPYRSVNIRRQPWSYKSGLPMEEDAAKMARHDGAEISRHAGVNDNSSVRLLCLMLFVPRM